MNHWFLNESLFAYVWFENTLFSARFLPLLKDAITQQKATNVIKESHIFWSLQVEHGLLCTTGLQTVSKRLNMDTEREQHGGNWVGQTSRITQPNLSSLKSVKKPTSGNSELSPLRIWRRGKVEWNLNSFGTTVAVVHWLTWKKSPIRKRCYWRLSLDFFFHVVGCFFKQVLFFKQSFLLIPNQRLISPTRSQYSNKVIKHTELSNLLYVLLYYAVLQLKLN